MEILVRDSQPLQLLVKKRSRTCGTERISGSTLKVTRFIQPYKGEHRTSYVDYVPRVGNSVSNRPDYGVFHTERFYVQGE